MKQTTIAVFGDSFVDSYWLGEATRLSPEAPIPVVKIHDYKTFPGGAGNVSLNLRSLRVNTLSAPPRAVTIHVPTKHRLMAGPHQIARWDQNDEQAELELNLINFVRANAVIISDYGKGSITYAVIEAIAALSLPTFIDTKRSPRDFDIIEFPYFFPNQKEYEAHLNDYRLQPHVILKRGPLGIEYQNFGRVHQSLPTYARNVVSVCGAGDTVIAAYAYAQVGTDRTDILEFANAAAAVVVEKPYTATATIEEINGILARRS